MTEELTMLGGLCAPVSMEFWIQDEWFVLPSKYGCYDARTWWQKIRRWFILDKGWGYPLEGIVPPRLRYLFPKVTVQRGGITYRRAT